MREEPPAAAPPEAWIAQAPREVPGRPAWLSEPEPPAAPASPLQRPDDTIQGSRERLTSRWFALKTLFEGAPPAPLQEPIQQPANSRVPALALFSLAGGVGKTSMVATLGRALSSRGERVLLVDTAAFGLLPFFFGARDQRLGQLRTFSPPASSGDSPIQMITLDPEAVGVEQATQDPLTNEISSYARGLSRVIIDLATASGSTARRALKLSPLVLVPIMPDMNSVVSVGSIDSFFEHNSGAAGKLPYYLLNQFDSSLPLHLDVREVLREQVGERLLPFALRRSPTVSEALAEGMTVMDYAPNSTIAEDFGSLVGWVKSLSAPASGGYRGVRWSER
jgi:cellulose synthase operon protein YhjQ